LSTFRVTLRALPADTPAIIRLRAALKAFRRRYGLVAIEAVEVPASERKKTPPRPVAKRNGKPDRSYGNATTSGEGPEAGPV
jgi:hypothetical protein